LDCATRDGDRVVVWDWKTGRGEQSGPSLQMACYSLYASTSLGVPLDRVVARRYDLMHDRLDEETISAGSLEEVKSYIAGSIKDMRSLLDDPDKNAASEQCFAKVEKREICYRCNFLRVCQPDL
jgi:hypothetical protein